MRSVQPREQAGDQSAESGFFEVGRSPAPQSEASPSVAPAPAGADPLLEAFSEVRGLNSELQQANDALHAVNETLRTKVDQLRRTALDLEQMLDGLELGVLLLDDELVVRHFNATAAHFLALEDNDLGGSISASCRSLGPHLTEWCCEVLRSGKRVRRCFSSAIGEPLSLQVRRARVDGELRLILVFAEATSPLLP